METVILYKNVIEVFNLQQVKNYSEYPRQEKKVTDSDNIFNVTKVGDDNKVTYNLSGNIKKQERYEFEYLDKESREVSEDVFLSHLNDPLSHLSVRRVTLVLEKCGDKLKLSIYRFYKERKVGAKYFWKKSSNLYYVFNKKSGNFFTIKSEKSGRKKNNTINQNNFDSLMNNIKTLLYGHLGIMDDTKQMEYDIKYKFPVSQVYKVMSTELGVHHYPINEFKSLVVKWFVNVNNIKHPNNFVWLFNHYPGKKVLKKFDMNLGKAVLVTNNAYSKFTNTFINLYGKINLERYFWFQKFLGNHYIKKLDPRILQKDVLYFPNNVTLTSLQGKEIDNLITLLNLSLESMYVHEHDVIDHVKLKHDLKRNGVKVTIESNTIDSFTTEHHTFSETLESVKRTIGTYFHYDEKFIKHIESPFTYNGMTYTPYILKNDLEYKSEGSIQKHCVGGYHNRFDSYIVSVRDENDVRMTVEYKLINGNFVIIQSRMKFNEQPKNDWVTVNDILETKMDECLELKLFKTPKITKNNIITGQVINVEQEGGVLPEDIDKLLKDESLHRFDYDLLF